MIRVSVISDSVDHVDGISIGLRRLAAASQRAGHAMTLVGPTDVEPRTVESGFARRGSCAAWRCGVIDEIVRVPAAMSAALPMYPQYTWSWPELPALTAHLARNADLVQLATPGPMGLAGLIAARMLGLPVIAQYHTEVPEYAARLTGLPFVKDLVAPFVGWFYQQAELCLAPSQTVADRLIGLGVAAANVRRIQRGVDLALFDPARRDRACLVRYGIEEAAPVALYVGRLSKEKNLDGLRAAWRLVIEERPDARLVVVGEGPQSTALDGDGVLRTGVLYGEELATVFASADVFAFASETETFGNVVVEAASSGLPAVVAAAGAAHEHVIVGEAGDGGHSQGFARGTGVVVDGRDPQAFAREVVALFADPARRARMGASARAHARTYDLDAAVASTWELYRDVAATASRSKARVAS